MFESLISFIKFASKKMMGRDGNLYDFPNSFPRAYALSSKNIKVKKINYFKDTLKISLLLSFKDN
jgi:hypothetical protein